MRRSSQKRCDCSRRLLSPPAVRHVSRNRLKNKVVVNALFEPPLFKPSKLNVSLLPGTSSSMHPTSRRYTLTHNDITGELWLSIGHQYNTKQVSGFYTRLLRDEVTAEWKQVGQSLELHVFCHVSGEERWLAPPALRNYIFRREMTLVLDCVVYGDRDLIDSLPSLAKARVFVHFQSSLRELDKIESWGMLGDRDTWQQTESILKRVLLTLTGRSTGPSTTKEEDDSIKIDHEKASTSSETSIRGTLGLKNIQNGIGSSMENGLNGIAIDDLLTPFEKTRPVLMRSRLTRKR